MTLQERKSCMPMLFEADVQEGLSTELHTTHESRGHAAR